MKIALVGAELEENLALRYIWGALKTEGHDVTMVRFDALGDIDQAARELARSGARLAGFSMVFTHRGGEFAELARRARAEGFDGHLIAGGHFATLNAEALLNEVPAFDSVGCGEGEELMCDLARHLDDLNNVKGLVWRDVGRGCQPRHPNSDSVNCVDAAVGDRGLPSLPIIKNPAAIKARDLDRLAHPIRKIPFDDFFGLPIVNMLGSRGCTHHCAFCSISAWHKHCGGPALRQRKPELIAEEMAQLYRDGVRLFNFHDDNFLVPNRRHNFARAEALANALAERGVGRIGLAIKARPDDIERKLFEYLKTIGLFRVFIGIEAGTELSLHALGRSQTLDQNHSALRTLNELDIHACFNMLLFAPDTTLEELRGNVGFLHDHPHNPMNFCRTEIYAGTPLEEKMRREGRLLGDFWGYDYRIGDDRVQRAFELVEESLHGRHRGLSCLNHLAMQIDYENQILGHFFGVRPRIRKNVKDFVTRLNRNTCRHLLDVVGAVESHGAGFDWKSYTADLRGRMEKDNEKFRDEARRLLIQIHSAANTPRRSSAMRRTVAAGVMLGLAVSCKSPVYEMIAKATPIVVQKESPLDAELRALIIPILIEVVPEPRDVSVLLRLESPDSVQQPRVALCWIEEPNGERRQLRVPESYRVKNIDPGNLAAKYSISFTKSEIEAAKANQHRPHMWEYVAAPSPIVVAENSPLSNELRMIILPSLAEYMGIPPRDVKVIVRFDSPDGREVRIASAWIEKSGGERKPLELKGGPHQIKNKPPQNLGSNYSFFY